MITAKSLVLLSLLLLPVTTARATSTTNAARTSMSPSAAAYRQTGGLRSPRMVAASSATTTSPVLHRCCHRPTCPLQEIKETLDTGADAFAAKWSDDSQQVSVVYRVDRHAPLKAVSYRIVGRRARSNGAIRRKERGSREILAGSRLRGAASRRFSVPLSNVIRTPNTIG